MSLRIIASLLILLCQFLAMPAVAQADKYIAGTHYTVLEKPVRTADPSRIEVAEVFWYGCPFCFNFEPLMNNWVQNSPADINFVRFPAIFNSLMGIHAQVFYTAQALNVVEQVHDPIFNTLVVQRKQLQTEDQIVALFADHGVDKDATRKAFNSFSVKTKLKQAQKLTNDYKARGTPSMVVNGKYIVSIAGAVSDQQLMLDVVDYLVEEERTKQAQEDHSIPPGKLN